MDYQRSFANPAEYLIHKPCNATTSTDNRIPLWFIVVNEKQVTRKQCVTFNECSHLLYINNN